MAIAVLISFVFVLVVTLVWASTQESGAAGVSAPSGDTRAQKGPQPRVTAPEQYVTPSAVFVVFGERCRSARKAVSYYRDITYDRQRQRAGRLADRTPIVRGKTCRWARHAADTWQARARAAQKALERWRRSIGQVVARLNRGLAGTPMAGTGAILERWGRRYGISPFFMAATAATESSLGAAACSNNRYNVWGLASCTGSWYVPAFASWDEAIAFYARYLTRTWSSHSTPYSFRGYAECDACWGRSVSELMSSLFGVPAVTTYP